MISRARDQRRVISIGIPWLWGFFGDVVVFNETVDHVVILITPTLVHDPVSREPYISRRVRGTEIVFFEFPVVWYASVGEEAFGMSHLHGATGRQAQGAGGW